MELLILRHGEAVPRGSADYPNDSDRPLTSRGIKDMRRIAKGMRGMDLSIDHILSSRLVRAKQTAEIAVGTLSPDRPIEYSEHLEPEGDIEMLINELTTKCGAQDHVLLVGHEPHLSQLISFLACGDDSLEMNLRKGGLCKLEVSSLRFGKCAVLEWLLTPRQLKNLK